MGREVYAVIDLKSFYVSCECAARGLDIFSTPLVVADKSRSKNSVVMSATPLSKGALWYPKCLSHRRSSPGEKHDFCDATHVLLRGNVRKNRLVVLELCRGRVRMDLFYSGWICAAVAGQTDLSCFAHGRPSKLCRAEPGPRILIHP